MDAQSQDQRILVKRQKYKVRQRANRAIPSLVGMTCEHCGGEDRLQRHHPSHIDEPDRVEILCHPCHIKADIAVGTKRGRIKGKKYGPNRKTLNKIIPDNATGLSAFLISWRKRLDFTQAKAGELLGMPLRTIQAWEAGRPTRYVSDTLVLRACRDVERETRGG